MDPAQNQNQNPVYPEKDQQLQNFQNPQQHKSNPIMVIVLAFFLIIISLLIFLGIVLLYSNKEKVEIQNANPITTTGDFQEFRKNFTSSINLKPVSFLSYDTTDNYRILNNDLNIEDVVRIGCSSWESNHINPTKNSKKNVNTLNIVYGVVGRGDFWSVSFIKEDLEINKSYYLPIYLNEGPPKYGQIYVFTDNKEFDSGAYNSMGFIKINKFEGCESGNEIQFEINAILGQNEENEDIYYELDDESGGIQMIGEFSGKVNLESGKSAFDILIPQDEYKTFVTSVEKAKNDRLERLRSAYLEEYGYDEEYDYFFDDYDYEDDENYEETAINNDTKRQSDVTQIINAIGAYRADNSVLPEVIDTNKDEIASDGVDLCDYIVSSYIPSLPTDPSYESGYITDCDDYYYTGYFVVKDKEGKVTVSAEGETTGEDISITR